MAGKNFGVTVRDMEQEKSPPLWQIILLGILMSAGFYAFVVAIFSLPIIFPGVF
jgi:hypothetical protein